MAHAPSEIPASATTAGDGIATGTGPVTVDAYIDFLCPYCRAFEQASGPGLDQLIADRAITLVYHPMAFLDDASTTRYSSRAAAASACAADGGQFPSPTPASCSRTSRPRAGPACPTTS